MSAGVASASSPAPASEPSAIGNESSSWIVVSPAYQTTGLVAALANASHGCTGAGCIHLWVSHDGGSSWARAAAHNFGGGRFTIGADGKGQEVLFSEGPSGTLRSDDYGDNWTSIGAPGTPTVAPSYPTEGTVAVAGSSDYVYHQGATTAVPGSGGSVRDVSFAFSPSFPTSVHHAPVLLSAADPKSGLPVIQTCTASLACSGNATLSGASTFSVPVTLEMSTAFDDDGVVFAQSGRGLYKSNDGGATFAPLAVGQSGATATATPQLALAPGYKENSSNRTAWAAVLQTFNDPSRQYGLKGAGGIYRTTDGGATWSIPAPGPFSGGATAVAVAPDGRLFGAYLSSQTGFSGLLCSTDQGVNWQVSCPSVGSWRASHSGGDKAAAATPCAGSGCSQAHPAQSQGAGPSGPTGAAAGNMTGNAGASKDAPPSTPTAATTGHSPNVAIIVAVVLGTLALVGFAVVRLRMRRQRLE
jgi:hypothetical protein